MNSTDALKEYKDWQTLRATSHLKKAANGTKSDEVAVLNSIEGLKLMQKIQKTQLGKYEEEAERVTAEINEKSGENKILRAQIDDVKSKVAESENTYNELSKVSKMQTARRTLDQLVAVSNLQSIDVLKGQEQSSRTAWQDEATHDS